MGADTDYIKILPAILGLTLVALLVKWIAYLMAYALVLLLLEAPVLGLYWLHSKRQNPKLSWESFEQQPSVALLVIGLGGVIGLVYGGIEVVSTLHLGYSADQQLTMLWFSSGAGAILGSVIVLARVAWLQQDEVSNILRGSRLISAKKLQRHLARQQARLEQPRYPLLEIGVIELPNELEHLSFLVVGSSGSGKTQAIKRLLFLLRQRPDVRVMVLDRNAELLESFYRHDQDLLFNPKDARSLAWSHTAELGAGMEAETIAAALVPEDPKDRFFSEAATALFADLLSRCESNCELWEVISQFTLQEIQDFCAGGLSSRYFGAEKTGASVLSTLVNQLRFVRRLADAGPPFSFVEWGRSDDPRWLFLPLFEEDADLFKGLFSLSFELVLRGLLSHPEPDRRQLSTFVVIDELGALNALKSLPRLLSEARKFKGSGILGTQAAAQIDEKYGQLLRDVVLQGTATKLILNCRDEATAQIFAGAIGRQERLDQTRSFQPFSPATYSEQIRETYTVMPAELQTLAPLHGYLATNGLPVAPVVITPQSYSKVNPRFLARSIAPNRPHRERGTPIL